MALWRDFNASNKEDTCLWCGNKLRHPTKHLPWPPGMNHAEYDEYHKANSERHELGGDYHDGFFCGLRCAYQFAERLAQLGRRLQEKNHV